MPRHHHPPSSASSMRWDYYQTPATQRIRPCDDIIRPSLSYPFLQRADKVHGDLRYLWDFVLHKNYLAYKSWGYRYLYVELSSPCPLRGGNSHSMVSTEEKTHFFPFPSITLTQNLDTNLFLSRNYRLEVVDSDLIVRRSCVETRFVLINLQAVDLSLMRQKSTETMLRVEIPKFDESIFWPEYKGSQSTVEGHEKVTRVCSLIKTYEEMSTLCDLRNRSWVMSPLWPLSR